MEINLKPGDFACVEWTGPFYDRFEMYGHIVEINDKSIKLNVNDDKIFIIPKQDINSYEIKTHKS